MRIHECARCEGCGYIIGGFRWEAPWSQWSPDGSVEDSVLPPHPCPDCGGTGALIELDLQEPEPVLPSRRGLPVRNSYARHVALVLRNQRS